jgi:hypothetical protein
MAFDDPAAGDGVLTAAEYDNLVDAVKNQTDMGTFTISAAGSLSVTGVGFQPSQLMFWCESVGGVNQDRAGTGGDGATNYAGSSVGFAADDGTRQVVNSGMSGNSVNNSSHFSSDTGEVIALRYAGQNGTISSGGVLQAELTSFDSDGFTLNVTDFNQTEPVFYIANRF